MPIMQYQPSEPPNGDSPLIQTIDASFAATSKFATTIWNAERERLGRVFNIRQYRRGDTVIGFVDLPAPLETGEGVPAPMVNFGTEGDIGAIKTYGVDWPLSVQLATKTTGVAYFQTIAALARHIFTGAEDAICNQLTGLSLPSAQTDTTLMAGVGKANLLRTALGGVFPEPAVIFASSSLRLRAANERWSDAYPVTFTQFLPVGVCYILPEANSNTIIFPIVPGVNAHCRNGETAAAGWRITLNGFAASSASVLRQDAIIRVTLP